jgi:hypothetical protein
MKLSYKEQKYVDKIAAALDELQTYLSKHGSSKRWNQSKWFLHLAKIKSIQGNFNLNLHFLACVLAKRFLNNSHCFNKSLDVGNKPQGAAGVDILVTTANREKIAAEVKTTTPYGKSDFGAQQKESFLKDFKKLKKAKADFKYLFVTDPKAYEFVIRRYTPKLAGVTIVCLSTDKKHKV